MSADPASPASSSSPPPAAPSGPPPGHTPGYTGAIAIPTELRHVEADPHGGRLAILTLTALGVVFGDIGTSPLYALKECFGNAEYALAPTPANVYGVLSLILWSLTLVVSVKYIGFIMRADNRGEGGILAMLALILQKQQTTSLARRAVLIALGLFGAALLYGDGIITPAISVLGAMEGLEVISPRFHAAIVPVTMGILLAVFAVQRFGTHAVGRFFGPVMLLWFVTIAGLGVMEVARDAHILAAINPLYGVAFFRENGGHGFVVLGAVVLSVTGAEALYADMGHFGKKPIRLAWLWLVFPCLLMNYFGQGALILRDPTAATNPFYNLAPRELLYPLLGLATAAAIIASQALISGAYSITQQCVQLGYSPRMTITHTSADEAGQIYIPEVNSALAIGTLLVVLGFRSSSALGAAYGIAVTGTMAITSVLFAVIAARRWGWPQGRVLALVALFLAIDLAFFGANVIKIAHGGWVPLVVAVGAFILMTTWKRGRDILRQRLLEISMPLDTFLGSLNGSSVPRVPGTAVFMTSEQSGTPVVLLHHLKHNKVLHKQVILLSILGAEVPEVPRGERVVRVERLDHGVIRAVAQYGFMQSPDVKEVMERLREAGVQSKPLDTSYYLGREKLIPRKNAWKKGGMSMATWRKHLFAAMATNSRSAAAFFQLPPNRVVELGTQIEF